MLGIGPNSGTPTSGWYVPAPVEEEEVVRPSAPWGRRFLHEGIAFNVDEDDEELLMMLAAAVPLINRSRCP